MSNDSFSEGLEGTHMGGQAREIRRNIHETARRIRIRALDTHGARGGCCEPGDQRGRQDHTGHEREDGHDA